MKFSILLLTLFVGFAQISFAGNGGRGADEISRLVNKARNEIIPDIISMPT